MTLRLRSGSPRAGRGVRRPAALLLSSLLAGVLLLEPMRLADAIAQVPSLQDARFAGLQWTFVRIRYSAFTVDNRYRLDYWGEPWAIDAPAAEQNLSRRLRTATSIEVNDPIVLQLDDPKLWDHAWVYFVEPGNLRLRDDEVSILREFLLRGGTATFDDFHGPYEWDNFASEMRRDLGEGRVRRAAARHSRRSWAADGARELEYGHGRRRRVVECRGVSRLRQIHRRGLPYVHQRNHLQPHALEAIDGLTSSHTMSVAAAVPNFAERVQQGRARILTELRRVIVGQDEVVDQVLIALFTGGHCLITGVPGLAKTLLIKTLAAVLDLRFKRIQFTPDLMPSDITGTEILDEQHGTRTLRFVHGPIFAQIILADEINRTPPKTQAALLEAMQEYHVTAAGRTYQLERPFFVLATQNPIELEGTYPLPEAQLDRFMFNVVMTYLPEDDEVRVVTETTGVELPEVARVLGGPDILEFQHVVRQWRQSIESADAYTFGHCERVARYAVQLVSASRPGQRGVPEFVDKYVKWGAGLRASQAMILGGKARALMHGRHHVSIKDIQALAAPILRHRIVTNFYAESENLNTDGIVTRLIEAVPVPRSGLAV